MHQTLFRALRGQNYVLALACHHPHRITTARQGTSRVRDLETFVSWLATTKTKERKTFSHLLLRQKAKEIATHQNGSYASLRPSCGRGGGGGGFCRTAFVRSTKLRAPRSWLQATEAGGWMATAPPGDAKTRRRPPPHYATESVLPARKQPRSNTNITT